MATFLKTSYGLFSENNGRRPFSIRLVGKHMWLACDQVGAEAMGELSDALGMGALRSLQSLFVSHEGYAHLKAACRQRGVTLGYLKEGGARARKMGEQQARMRERVAAA